MMKVNSQKTEETFLNFWKLLLMRIRMCVVLCWKMLQKIIN
ncbi:unnamed protein product [Linum tenue]|uniref:Uncharacterized protein n=1 Tax=Linum tenue TaxID=586396 RepID=A0AAV0RVS4_9ROSI|nr:unnamed protein product [Linum tenue]